MSNPSRCWEIQECGDKIHFFIQLMGDLEYVVSRDRCQGCKAVQCYRALDVFLDYDNGYTKDAYTKASHILVSDEDEYRCSAHKTSSKTM